MWEYGYSSLKDSTLNEVEKIKAVKIAQIKEQQGKQCPVCYNTAIQHRFNSNSADQKFAYKCCNSECNTDNLKTARARRCRNVGCSQETSPLGWLGTKQKRLDFYASGYGLD